MSTKKNTGNEPDQKVPKTREEVEALKLKWLENPIGNIEETEGFEEFYDELASFRLDQEQIWDAEAQKSLQELKRAEVSSLKSAYLRSPKRFTEEFGNLEDQEVFEDYKQELLEFRLATETDLATKEAEAKENARNEAYMKLCNANALETANIVDYFAGEALKSCIPFFGIRKENIPHITQWAYEIGFAMATEKQRRELELTENKA